VVDEEKNEIGLRDRFVHVREFDVGKLELGWERFQMGLNDEEIGFFIGQVLNNFQGGALSDIVDVGFEREAEASDGRIFDVGESRFDFGEDVVGLAVVHFSGSADEACEMGSRVDDEPRIDGDAMASDARAWLENFHAGVPIGEFDELPNVDIEFVADKGELVRKGDVDVAEGIFGELGHLGCAGIGGEALAFNEDLIELFGEGCGGGGEATDDPVIADNFPENVAGKDPFRAVGDVEVELGEPFGEFFSGADRRGGLEDDEIAVLEDGRNGFGCSFDVGEVGFMVVFERGRNGDDEHLSFFRFGYGFKLVAYDCRVDERFQIGFNNVDFSLVDHVDGFLVDVDADDLDAMIG
jgi:hypothetical protein